MAPPARASSVELASPSRITQYSRKTGRPIRRGAGKVKPVEGYVDSKVIEEELEEPIDTPSEDEDGEPIKHQRKRKRTPSLSPPPLDLIIREEEPNDPSDDEEGLFQQKAADKAPITLQFNIPLGFHGPLMVKLDRSMLTQDQPEGTGHDMQPLRKKRQLTPGPSEPSSLNGGNEAKTSSLKRKGFTDLPPELRNKIYRHMFVTGDVIGIPRAKNLCRSGQFLSTCRLVQSEGCSVLYGENTIILDRSRARRGPFWEPQPKEIGYTDSRRFLKVIGPENLRYLRDVKLVLEDACPSATPYLTHEERRYVVDEHLIDILRFLRRTKLRDFTLTFFGTYIRYFRRTSKYLRMYRPLTMNIYTDFVPQITGRRSLLRTDTKILRYLEQIKADEVFSKNVYPTSWYYSPKIAQSLWEDLKASMTREKKLYVKKK